MGIRHIPVMAKWWLTAIEVLPLVPWAERSRGKGML